MQSNAKKTHIATTYRIHTSVTPIRMWNIFILYNTNNSMSVEDRLHINVSTTDYDKTSKIVVSHLARLEQMTHTEDEFSITDSEFAFGWHFFVLSVNRSLVEKLRQVMGPADYDIQSGKGTDKKFLTWLARDIGDEAPRFKLAIKEEMESSKFGIF